MIYIHSLSVHFQKDAEKDYSSRINKEALEAAWSDIVTRSLVETEYQRQVHQSVSGPLLFSSNVVMYLPYRNFRSYPRNTFIETRILHLFPYDDSFSSLREVLLLAIEVHGTECINA